tara:strand:+ start:377 stop:1819 length:1443 start_codon:yes stop_codon:yes gene_type:complete
MKKLQDYPFKTEPFAHQLAALGAALDKEEFAWFMEMGTGKTLVAIYNASWLWDRGDIETLMVIAPKTVYKNWKRELKSHLPEHITPDIFVWGSDNKAEDRKKLEKVFLPNDNFKILLMNVEAFSTKKGVDFAKKFLLSHKAMVAVDESTTIKNPTAARTKNILKLSPLIKYRRIMTGSPVTRSPIDLYAQCAFLSEDLLGFSSFWTFKNRYCVMVKRNMPTHQFSMIVSYQRLGELADKLDNFSYRVLKDDCLDLPEKIYQVRNVSMTPKQLEMYVTMKRMAIAELEGERLTALSALTQILRLHQIVCGHVKLDNGEVKAVENNRLKELMNILDETSGKVLIWANYRHDIQTIATEISKVHGPRSVATFYGDTPSEERQQIVDEFQNGEELRYFVGNPKTGGYGLTLTKSHTVIYYSNSYDLEVRLQSEDRVHRIGQTSKVTYVDLVTEGTVDEKIVQSLRNKINLATEVMGEELKQWLI